MVHLSKLKMLSRWATMGLAGFLGAYGYSYLHADHPAWTDAARYGVLPLLHASGALAWVKAQAVQLAEPLRASPFRKLAA